MTLELMQQEKFEEGKEKGREEGRRETAALFEQIFTKAEIQGIKVDYSRLQDSAYMSELCQKLNIIQ